MVFCKDCCHLAWRYNGATRQTDIPVCSHPSVASDTDVVTGETIQLNPSPYSMREADGVCGPEGRLFEQRP